MEIWSFWQNVAHWLHQVVERELKYDQFQEIFIFIKILSQWQYRDAILGILVLGDMLVNIRICIMKKKQSEDCL